jgi:hypothetical protein
LPTKRLIKMRTEMTNTNNSIETFIILQN